jgi:membrane protein required for beta-lactamase induction
MDYLEELVFAVLLAIPVACVTWTFTQEELFREVREFLQALQRRHRDSWWRRKLAFLPTCPYCFSHYVAALFVALLQFKMLSNDWRGYVVSIFTLVLIANVYLTGYHLLRVALRGCRAWADGTGRRRSETIPRRTVPICPFARDKSAYGLHVEPIPPRNSVPGSRQVN